MNRLILMRVFAYLLILILVACGESETEVDNVELDNIEVQDPELVVESPVVTNPTRKTPMLVKTGQEESYDENGDITTDNSIKDDGYYQSGLQHEFVRDNDIGIVADNATGLMWQDIQRKEKVSKAWIDPDRAEQFNYTNVSGDTAHSYCENLDFGDYDDWRLPSVYEFGTISKYNEILPGVSSEFEEIRSNDAFWTSSSIAGDNHQQSYYYHLSAGYIGKNFKTKLYFVMCVRGEEFQDSNFSRENGVVTDNVTGLQWQDEYDNDDVNIEWSWVESLNYCENLELAGLNDWRVPNINELKSVVDVTKTPAVDTHFEAQPDDLSVNYFSSTAVANHPENKYMLATFLATIDPYLTDNDVGYIRCVRGNL